jgi:hypothetical protein
MVEWSRAFGGVPVHQHAADRQWVMRPDKSIAFWDGDTKPLGDSLTLVRCGGHFDGGTVLHWLDGAGGKGALLTGDIIQVVADRKHVSFMYSYPNYVPLSAAVVDQIVRVPDANPSDTCCGGKSLGFACRQRGLDGEAVLVQLLRRLDAVRRDDCRGGLSSNTSPREKQVRQEHDQA